MVVLAVIGALLACFLPGFHAGKAKARRADCRDNLRLLSTSLSEYASQFDKYPTGKDWAAVTLDSENPFRPYLPKSSSKLVCPESDRIARTFNLPGADRCSYGFNASGTGPYGQETGLGMGFERGIAPSRIRLPSEMIAKGDSGVACEYEPWINPNVGAFPAAEQSQLPSRRHGGVLYEGD